MLNALLPGFKRFSEVSHNLDDDFCRELLQAAIELIETRYHIAIERRSIREQVPPVAGVVQPTYWPDGRAVSMNGRHVFVGADRAIDSNCPVLMSYTTGYEPGEVPALLKQAIYRIALFMREHRGDNINRQNFGALHSGLLEVDPIKESGAGVLLRSFRSPV